MRFTNGSIFIENRLRRDVALAVEDGRLRLDADAQGPEIDLEGGTLAPGFIDLHTHGYKGADVMQGESAVRHMAREYTKHGVTAFLPTTMADTIPTTRQAVRGIAAVMEKPEPDGAVVLGAHMEGPFFCPAHRGAQPLEALLPPSLESYRAMTEEDARCVRLLTLAPEYESAPELIRALCAQGVTVSCGHSAATYAQFRQSVAQGVRHVTHLFNAQTALHHREPGIPGGALDTPEVTVELIADGIHIHPALLRIVLGWKGPERVALVTDSMMATGLPDGEYSIGSEKTFVRDGVARTAAGNLAGSTLTLDRALRNLIGYGVSPADILPMLTSTPARQAGATDRGRIANGLRADLVWLDAQWQVRATMIDGNWVYGGRA